MTVHRRTARRRLVAAVDVLRGRRPGFDYGILLVMPFVAAAGGALLALAVDEAVERRRAPAGRGGTSDGTDAARDGTDAPGRTTPVTSRGSRR